MNLPRQTKATLSLGFFFLGLAVAIGAFGAHGLKNLVNPQQLEIFETGVRYHFFHGIGLVLIGIYSQVFHRHDIKVPLYAFLLGIFLFSFNCYVYVLTSNKVFAMMMPVGGLFFIIGWMSLAWNAYKLK